MYVGAAEVVGPPEMVGPPAPAGTPGSQSGDSVLNLLTPQNIVLGVGALALVWHFLKK